MKSCETYQELISAMLDGELTKTEQAEVLAHVASCDECRALYDAFSAISAAVSAENDVPDSLHDGIMARVHAANQATKTLGKLLSIRRVLSVAACLIVIVGTVFALRNNLFSQAKSAADAMASGTMNENTAGAEPMEKAEAEVAMYAMEEGIEESFSIASASSAPAVFSSADTGGGDTIAEEIPSATEASEPAPSQNDSIETAGAQVNSEIMLAWRSPGGKAENVELYDIGALCEALSPKYTELTYDTASKECNCILTLERVNGTEQRLLIYYDGDCVWVEQDGAVFLASCTPDEFEAIR